MTYRDNDDDSIIPPIDLSDQFGHDDPDDISKLLDDRFSDSKINGIIDRGCKLLRDIIEDYRSLFGVKLVTHAPEKVEPCQVQLKPNAKPFKATQHRYGPQQYSFITSTTKILRKSNPYISTRILYWQVRYLRCPNMAQTN